MKSAVPVVQVFDSIGLGRGGLTRAVLDRFTLLAQDAPSILAIVSEQPNAREVFSELKRQGRIPEQTELWSFFADLLATSGTQRPMENPQLQFAGSFRAPESARLVRHYADGVFVGLETFANDGTLRSVEIHDPLRPWEASYRELYFAEGNGVREYLDSDRRVKFRTHFRKDRVPVLSSWLTLGGYAYRAVDLTTPPPAKARDLRGVNADWLRRRLEELPSAVVYTDEPRTTFALEIARPGVAHITSVHSTHVANNRDHSDGLKHWVEPIKASKSNIHRLVAFTRAQTSDLLSDLDWDEQKLEWVHHRAPAIAEPLSDVNAREGLVVVCRLAEDKRVDLVIKAFERVLVEFPHQTLTIVGDGPTRESLEELATSLGIQDSVRFLGYIADPSPFFSQAKASVVSSKYEGLGLVILESMAQGTPVVAFDVMYGPRELVSTGINGFLVPDGDIPALAEAMLQVLSTTFPSKLSTGARETARAYSREVWAADWQALHSSAVSSVLQDSPEQGERGSQTA